MNKKESKAIANYILKNTAPKRNVKSFPYNDKGDKYTIEFKQFLDLEDSELFVKTAIQLGLTINEKQELSIHNERFEVIKFVCIIKYYTDFNISELTLKDVNMLMHNQEFYNFIMLDSTIDYDQANNLFNIAVNKMNNIYSILVNNNKSSSEIFVESAIKVLAKIDQLLTEVSKGVAINNLDPDKLTEFIDTVSKFKNIDEDKIISEIAKATKDINDKYDSPVIS